jgi:hypothetical protein
VLQKLFEDKRFCTHCGRQFIDEYDPPPGYSKQINQECLKMDVNGMGFRAIERVKGVDHTTIIYWVKQLGEPLPDAPEESEIPEVVATWQSYFYVTDGYKVYPSFIADGDQIISKTYMTRVENENTRLRHYLARLHRQTLCYSKSEAMLRYSIAIVTSLLEVSRNTSS